MRTIQYYVASSLDGFIAGQNDDISGFMQQGAGVDQYLKDLQDFDTVIMGRRTYEFGYQYGLKPGKPAYPHMQHYIFSSSLHFENADDQVVVEPLNLETIKALKQSQGSPIYLCGGGEFAGWLLDHQQIDQLKIKLNPLILGDGIPLFGSSKTTYQLELIEQTTYPEGLQFITYNINYPQ